VSNSYHHAIRTQFRGPYHHYKEVLEDVKLKWWTYIKVIEYIFLSITILYNTYHFIFFYFCRPMLLGNLSMSDIFKRCMRQKLENAFLICSPKPGPK